MLNDLLYPEEHLACGHYISDCRCTFKQADIRKDAGITAVDAALNHLVFILSGEVLISCNEFTDRRFKAGEIAFLPKGSRAEMKTFSGARFLSCLFDAPDTVCDKLIFQSLWKRSRQVAYNFDPVPIHPGMQQFIDLMIVYLDSGIHCEHLHEIKQKELFLVFRWFYSREELVKLFHPMIGKSLDFKSMVLENYNKARSVTDLAQMAGMSRSSFDAMFKDVFGLSARQWMLRQTARHVRYQMTKPDATISDVMLEFGFNSFTHFNRFCKQKLGCSPSRLMKELRG